MQQKVFEELEAVTGGNRAVSASDRKDTPFTEAVILEIQRMGNIAPFGLVHSAAVDTTLGGYFIPKDTQVPF